MASPRQLDPADRIKLTLVIVDDAGNTIADAFGGGEDATLSAHAAAALLRAVADDLEPAPTRPRR